MLFGYRAIRVAKGPRVKVTTDSSWMEQCKQPANEVRAAISGVRRAVWCTKSADRDSV